MEKTKAAIAKVRKAIAAAVASAVAIGLKKAGIEIDNDTISVLVNAAIIAGVVWAVPNAKPYVEEN